MGIDYVKIFYFVRNFKLSITITYIPHIITLSLKYINIKKIQTYNASRATSRPETVIVNHSLTMPFDIELWDQPFNQIKFN